MVLYVHRNLKAYKGRGKNGMGGWGRGEVCVCVGGGGPQPRSCVKFEVAVLGSPS